MKNINRIIKENIDKFLLENISNEAYDASHNTLQQYFDWIEDITVDGSYKSKYKNVKSFLKTFTEDMYYEIGYNYEFYNGYIREEFSNEEYNLTIKGLAEKYGDKIYGDGDSPEMDGGFGEDLSPYGQKVLRKYLIETGKNALENYLSSHAQYVSKDCLIQVEREIVVPDMNQAYEDEDEGTDLYNTIRHIYSDFGDYWALGWGNGNTHFDCYKSGDYYATPFHDVGSTVKILGLIPIECVNFADTIGLETVGEEETYFDQSKLTIVGIEIDGKSYPFNPTKRFKKYDEY